MENKLQPLAVIFVWHPKDNDVVKLILDHCSSLLSRDIDKPFSRAMNLPIFYYTSSKKGVPNEVNISAEKIIIFPFIGMNIVADGEWKSYINNLWELKNSKVVPIALDNLAFNIGGVISYNNFIHFYEFQSHKNQWMFISITHEIYRYALNESFEEVGNGNDNSLKLFLSHAKDGKRGIKLAKKLKNFIDNTTMRNFFDATDIAPGYKFDEEIVNHIKEASIIAIHSDIYSSRYWCQREIIAGKYFERPLIAVNAIEEIDDRNFPFASNIPEIRIQFNEEVDEKDLLRILSTILLETVRFFYSKKLLNYYCDEMKKKIKCCCRPPEVADIEKLLIKKEGSIHLKYKSIIYPEPPVYSEEINFLNNLGIEVYTPLTIDSCNLKGNRIGISISNPSEEELINIGQNNSHLTKLSQDLARYLLAHSGTLVYGGDLRPNGFTEFLFNEAKILKARLTTKDIYLQNYIAWPIYKKDNKDIILWKAKYSDVAEMVELLYPKDVEDLVIDEETFLPPTNTQNLFVWSRTLTEMRKEMIDNCAIRICAGGRHSGYKGIMPGVLEEILISIEKKRPLFILGGFGGVASSVCNLIQNGIIAKELTLDWQISNNCGYKELLEFYKKRKNKLPVDYKSVIETIKNANLNNGLGEEENNRLFNTPFIDEAISLVLKGIKNIIDND